MCYNTTVAATRHLTLYQKLRRLTLKAKTKKLGVRALARELGRSPSHICRVLHGERRPSPALRRSLARLGAVNREQ